MHILIIKCFLGIYWITYEYIKQMSSHPTTFMYNFMAGSMAGSVIYFLIILLIIQLINFILIVLKYMYLILQCTINS